MGVIVDPTSGTRISRKALRIASPRLCPESRCSTIFSTTTIASSMTSPTAAASPPSVIRLKLCPRAHKAISVMAIVAGITRPATSELPQSRRNRTRMIAARMSPITIASRTLAIESRTSVDWL